LSFAVGATRRDDESVVPSRNSGPRKHHHPLTSLGPVTLFRTASDLPCGDHTDEPKDERSIASWRQYPRMSINLATRGESRRTRSRRFMGALVKAEEAFQSRLVCGSGPERSSCRRARRRNDGEQQGSDYPSVYGCALEIVSEALRQHDLVVLTTTGSFQELFRRERPSREIYTCGIVGQIDSAVDAGVRLGAPSVAWSRWM